MLNNTEYKSQTSAPIEVVDNQTLIKASVQERTAANAPRFNQARSAERRLRRERRYSRNTGLAVGGWRVTTW